MRKHAMALVAGLTILAPLASQAQTPDHPVGATMTTASDQVVCDVYYHEGSVIRRPVCGTKAWWTRRRLVAQQNIEEFQLRSFTIPAR
ncbi:MAG TPA: hypothetical protein VGF97_14535 [Rhizomicrobium sp.]